MVAHAARQLLPYLPEGDTLHPFSAARVLVEHRAKDIVTGGDGRWTVQVMDKEEVVAELAKRHGAEVARTAMQEVPGLRLKTEKPHRRETPNVGQREEQGAGRAPKENRKKKKLSEMGRSQRTVRPGDPE